MGMDLDSESESDSDSEDSEQLQWPERYPLTNIQRARLERLRKVLESENEGTDAVDVAFHEAVKEQLC